MRFVIDTAIFHTYPSLLLQEVVGIQLSIGSAWARSGMAIRRL